MLLKCYTPYVSKLENLSSDHKTGKKKISFHSNLQTTVQLCSFHMLTSEVTQSCPTPWNPMDSSLPGFSVHEIFKTRVLEWIASSFSRGSSRPRDWTRVSHIVGRCFTLCTTKEALISHANKVMFKSSRQASAICELRTSKCERWIEKRQRNQTSNFYLHWTIEKTREFQKKKKICFIDYTSLWLCGSQ